MLPLSTDSTGKLRICPICAEEMESLICVKDNSKTFDSKSVAGRFISLRSKYGLPSTSELIKSSKFGYDLRIDFNGIKDKMAFEHDVKTYIQALVEVSKPRVLVFSRDHRESGELLEHAFTEFAKESGLEYGVIYGSIPTTPSYFAGASIAYQTKKQVLSLQATASHNPPNYNGIKAMVGKFTHKIFPKQVEFSEQMDSNEILNDYILWCTRFNSYGDEITFDLNNGVGSAIIPKLAERLYPKANLLNSELLTDFGGKAPEPSWFVRWTGLGVAFDGDADRAPFYVNSKMIFFSRFLSGMIKEGLVKEKKVVIDQRTAPSMVDFLKGHGVKVILGDIGRTNQAELANHHNALWFEENWHTGGYPVNGMRFAWDDAIYATCFWFDKLTVPISQVLSDVPDFEYTEEKFKTDAGFNSRILEVLESRAMDYSVLPSGGARVGDETGHILMRESNTEMGTVKLFATGLDKDALKAKLKLGRELIGVVKRKGTN